MNTDKNTFKVIIAGGRDFADYQKLYKTANKILQNKKNIEIVSGGAKGADALGEKYAKEMSFELKIFPADWNKHGKGAGFIRNKQMADYADALIAYWNGESKGTKHMIETAKKQKLNIRIIKY